MNRDSIVLTGPRKVGKTGVGQELAEMLGCSFVDSTKLLEESGGNRYGFSGREAWIDFRSEESRVLQEICERYAASRIVLVVGGGAVAQSYAPDCVEKNAELLRSFGFVVCLMPFPSLQRSARIIGENTRRDFGAIVRRAFPDNDGGAAEFNRTLTMLTERFPAYRKAVDCILYTNGRPAEFVARDVLATLCWAGYFSPLQLERPPL